MTTQSSLLVRSAAVAVLILFAWSAGAQAETKAAGDAKPEDTKITPLMSHALGSMAGKEGTLLTVEYAPGAATSKHRHDADTFVYVLEGSIVMQVEGGQPVTLGPGETFHESPQDVHVVSRNASDVKPAKFLVFFVKDHDAPVLTPVQ